MKKTLAQLLSTAVSKVEIVNTELLAELNARPSTKVVDTVKCCACGRNEVPTLGDFCSPCEDSFDVPDEERYDAEQEELENLSWLAEQEEALSNEPSPATQGIDPMDTLALAFAQPTQWANCDCCGTGVIAPRTTCKRCEDGFDPQSPEEMELAQLEELENLAWLAEQEEAMSEPGYCEVCRVTPVSHGVEVCPQCEDAADPSDEERFAREEEERFAREEQEEAMFDFFAVLRSPTSNQPTVPTDGGLGTVVPAPGRRAHAGAPATESEKIRFFNISSDVEDQQHELAELERRHMYLRVHAQDSLDYQEALLDTVAEIESTKEYLAFIEAQRRDLMPEYFAR